MEISSPIVQIDRPRGGNPYDVDRRNVPVSELRQGDRLVVTRGRDGNPYDSDETTESVDALRGTDLISVVVPRNPYDSDVELVPATDVFSYRD